MIFTQSAVLSFQRGNFEGKSLALGPKQQAALLFLMPISITACMSFVFTKLVLFLRYADFYVDLYVEPVENGDLHQNSPMKISCPSCGKLRLRRHPR